MTDKPPPPTRFCTECGTRILPDALFCHNCGVPVDGRTTRAAKAAQPSPALRWGVPATAIVALIVLSIFRLGARDPATGAAETIPAAAGAMRAPDISSMTPTERADRLFNRVMRLRSEGKTDSAAFFAPMAIAAFGAITPMTAHARYDMGRVALVAGDVATASAQSDSILGERPTHLLGLELAARVANARGDSAVSRAILQRMIAAQREERASGLPEYTDHDADLRAAIEAALR